MHSMKTFCGETGFFTFVKHMHILCAGLTYAGPQRGLALFVSWGTAVAPEASHSFAAQTLT